MYVVTFIIKPLLNKFRNFCLRKAVEKQLENLEDDEKDLIYGLYNEYDHAYCFPMNDSTINMLNAKGFLFTYNQQAQVLDYSDDIGMIYKLQPIVVWSVRNIIKKKTKKADCLKIKLSKCKDKEKQKKMKDKIKTLEDCLKKVKSTSLDEYYGVNNYSNTNGIY